MRSKNQSDETQDLSILEKIAALVGPVPNLNDAAQQLHTGLKTINGMIKLGAEAKSLVAQSLLLSSSPGTLAGWSLRETGGASAATVRIFNGLDANSTLIASLIIPPNGDRQQWFMPGGIAFQGGLFYTITGGVCEGAIYLGTGL